MRTSVPKVVRVVVLKFAGMNVPEELIPEHLCWELLATASVGRLALSVRALPVILPVQYYLEGGRLVVCLGHHRIPERSLNDVIIAFAADAIDPVTRAGWSVQVQGRSVMPRRLDVDTACGQPGRRAGGADRARGHPWSSRPPVPVHRCPTGEWPGAVGVVNRMPGRDVARPGLRSGRGLTPGCRLRLDQAQAWRSPDAAGCRRGDLVPGTAPHGPPGAGHCPGGCSLRGVVRSRGPNMWSRIS